RKITGLQRNFLPPWPDFFVRADLFGRGFGKNNTGSSPFSERRRRLESRMKSRAAGFVRHSRASVRRFQ
ncbi:hypothetical protein, partial [Pyramidobacter porci]